MDDAGARPPAPSASTWFDECVMESEEWLIERILPRCAYVGLFGRRGSAKTFLGIELAARGALGQPFLGQPCDPFGTIYCVGEKKARFGKRIEAWRLANGRERLPRAVQIRWSVPNLLDPDDVERFIGDVVHAKAEFRARGAPLGAIVFDTLARALKHANVSDADAAGTAIEAIQHIIDRCKVTVVVLAHVAKLEGSSTQKGAGEWEDAADSLIRIDRKEEDALRTVTLTKQSDEADGLAFGFTLEVVNVGETPTGRRITSCVVRQADVPDRGTNEPVARLNAPAMMVLQSLGRMVDGGQVEPVPLVPHVKPGTKGVRLEALREHTYEMGLQRASQPAPEAPEAERRKWVEARKKSFGRAIERLQEARKIRQEGEWIWPL
jgi:hypothetical protein